MDSDSDDPFQEKDNFYEKQEEKENEISNSYNYKILNEISNKFFSELQKHDAFDHKSSWHSYSTLEPIKIVLNTQETLPGVCDLIRPSKAEDGFVRKILITFSSLILEIENTLQNSSLNYYESLYPLAFYNERLDEDSTEIKPGQAEEQIARMIFYFNEVYEKVLKLLTIGVNLFSQLICLYSRQNNPSYEKTFKYINFDIPFDYLGIILSYFNAIDTIVTNNQSLKEHWDKYRLMFHNVKSNPSQFNITDENKKKLEKSIKKINAAIFEKTCYVQSVKHLIKKAGLPSPSGAGFATVDNNPIFLEHFTIYLKEKVNKLSKDIGSFSESDEKQQLFQLLGLFGLYYQIMEKTKKVDKSLLRGLWSLQKKVTDIPIIYNAYLNIETFLNLNIDYYRNNPRDLDPRNIQTFRKDFFFERLKRFQDFVDNLKLNVLTWITRMESDLFETKLDISVSNEMDSSQKQAYQRAFLLNRTNRRIKLIITGISMASQLKKYITYLLKSFTTEEESITPEVISTITTAIEVIKVIQCEYYRMMPYIAANINITNRTLLEPLQTVAEKIITKVSDKIKGTSKSEQFYKDVYTVACVFRNNTQASPSKMRRIVCKMCFEVISSRKILEQDQIQKIDFTFWQIEVINQLSKEIERACDCQFLFQYQSIIPISLESIFKFKPKRLYFFSMAVNDTETPLLYNKFEENNGFEMIKRNRKNLLKVFQDYFLKKLAQQIEVDLRKQIHSVLIQGLNAPERTNINLNDYLTIKRFPLFDIVVDVKRFVEEYLNLTFYKMTTMNINDWKTYQQMRVLAKSKYHLNLHEIFLPSKNLEQGEDILEIIRKLSIFVQAYSHNLHSQIFIEKNTVEKISSTVKVIGTQQILNSLYTHGTGIVNSIVNVTYQYLSVALRKIVSTLQDDYIKSFLLEERNFWQKHKKEINYNYPYSRGNTLLNKIKESTSDYQKPLIDQIIKIIRQVGNAVSLTRCIRTALMDYNSQNANLLTRGTLEDFKMVANQIKLELEEGSENGISPNMLTNAQNSFNDANNLFCDTISTLRQTGENNINYLSLLVTSFGDAFTSEKIKDIDLICFLFTALTITFIEKLIVASDNLVKNPKAEAYFSDDGFIVGVCYCLKVFKIHNIFETLNWFPSVIQEFSEKVKEIEKKKTKKNNDFEIDERKNKSYLESFKMLYYTYSSATVLFNE